MGLLISFISCTGYSKGESIKQQDSIVVDSVALVDSVAKADEL